jgi:hypothetical protein
MDDEIFLQQFEMCVLPQTQFHHREHLKVAYIYLRRHGLADALKKIRAGINAINTAHRVPDAPDRGYHETITQAWVRLVDMTLREYGPAETADNFLDQHPQLLEKKALRLFYSKELMMSPRAKAEFVEPDLTQLPASKH